VRKLKTFELLIDNKMICKYYYDDDDDDLDLYKDIVKKLWGSFAQGINDWIRSNNTSIKVYKVAQSESSEASAYGNTRITISIFYDEVSDPSHKEHTRIKIFSSLIEKRQLEKAYESWINSYPKEITIKRGEGIKLTMTTIDVKDILQTESSFRDHYNVGENTTMTVVYNDFSEELKDANAKTKKGPPPPIILPPRDGEAHPNPYWRENHPDLDGWG